MIRRRRPRPKLSRTSRALTRLSPAPLLDPNVASPRPLDEADEASRRNRRATFGVVLLAVLMLAAVALGYALIQHYKDVGTQARGKLQDTLQQRYDGLAAQVRAGKDVAGQVTAACANPKARKVLVTEGVSCVQAAHVATSSAQPGQAGAQGSQGASGRGIVASTIVSGHLVLRYSDGAAVDVGAITGPSGADGKPGSAGQNGSNGSNGQSGSDGRGIASTVITASGHLTVTYTNGQTVDLGTVIGPTGSSGSNGAAGSNGVDGKDGAKGDTGAPGQPGVAGPSGAAGSNGAPGGPGSAGNPPASFTFTVPGLVGSTTYVCTPDGAAGPGTQPSYSCAPQPAPSPTP